MKTATSTTVVPTDGAELVVTVQGEHGRPGVLLHPSLGRPAADFHELTGRLVASGYRVAAIDPRGVAGSTPSTRPVTLIDLAADVATVARFLGLDQVHVVGHAHGNRVMRCTAAMHPGLVRTCTLIAAGGRIPSDGEAQTALRRCFDESLSQDERLSAIGTAFFAPGNDPSVWVDGWYAGAAARQRTAVVETPVDTWWSAGTVPMLVIQGLQDRVAPPGNGRLLAAERAGVRLVELDGAGHAMLPERPVQIADALIDFLATHEVA